MCDIAVGPDAPCPRKWPAQMTDYTRYAVYFAPPEGSTLARFGAGWLGWDAALGQAAPHPQCGLDVASITATPRKYGFHGTLSAPLRLADGVALHQLEEAVGALAGSVAAFRAAPLMLKRIGAFLALVPSQRSEALNALHARCVEDLVAFRAQPGEAELAKRRANGLTPQQDALLLQWGYPYVLQEFRFHLTLSGRLDDATAQSTQAVLTELTAPFCATPFEVTEIALFAERAQDGQFEILHRHALSG